jgi:hypothetical protein
MAEDLSKITQEAEPKYKGPRRVLGEPLHISIANGSFDQLPEEVKESKRLMDKLRKDSRPDEELLTTPYGPKYGGSW